MKHIMKHNDVYIFTPFQYERDWNWCFDGHLIYDQKDNKLHDTYWGFPPRTEHKQFTLNQIEKIGSIKFFFNLDDVKEITKTESQYYSNVYYLPEQHGCYPHYFIDKNIDKNKDTILANINSKLFKLERELAYITLEMQRLQEARNKVLNNDLNVVI